MSIIQKIVEGNEAEANKDLEALLNQKRDEVIALAKKEVLSKVMVPGEIK